MANYIYVFSIGYSIYIVPVLVRMYCGLKLPARPIKGAFIIVLQLSAQAKTPHIS